MSGTPPRLCPVPGGNRDTGSAASAADPGAERCRLSLGPGGCRYPANIAGLFSALWRYLPAVCTSRGIFAHLFCFLWLVLRSKSTGECGSASGTLYPTGGRDPGCGYLTAVASCWEHPCTHPAGQECGIFLPFFRMGDVPLAALVFATAPRMTAPRSPAYCLPLVRPPWMHSLPSPVPRRRRWMVASSPSLRHWNRWAS